VSRWKISSRIWWIGFVTFIISQVGHIPFNSGVGELLNHSGIVYWPFINQLIFNAIFLGFSAGLFEEGSRYLVIRYWAKDVKSWKRGFLFGAGHGGSEAIILGIIALVNYGVWLVMSQPGGIQELVNSGLIRADQVDAVQQQMSVIWSMPWYITLLPALERILTIPIQICMSILVTQGFIRKQWFWVWLAIIYHAIVDGSAVLSSHFLGSYWTEALIAIFTINSILIIILLRKPEPANLLEPVTKPIAEHKLLEVVETDENLERTQFQ